LNISTEEPDESAMNTASNVAKGITDLEVFTSWVAANMVKIDVE